MEVRLIAITHYLQENGYPEELIERAGKICYRSETRSDLAGFIHARIRQGHESIIEHASASFEISGISRACSHQLVRHRIASFSQESQRYVDMSDPEFVVPETIVANERALAYWQGFVQHAVSVYQELRRLGIPKEDARFILPNATATRLVVTMNFRELRHFFKLRCSPQAQWEIRAVAKRMLELIYPEAPATFRDLYDEFCLQE